MSANDRVCISKGWRKGREGRYSVTALTILESLRKRTCLIMLGRERDEFDECTNS